MKKTFIVLGALAVLMVAALAGMAYWLVVQLETDKNKKRTAAASAARWKDPDLDALVNGVSELKEETNEKDKQQV